MVITAFITALKAFISFLVTVMPSGPMLTGSFAALLTVWRYGAWVIGGDMVTMILGSVVAWSAIHMVIVVVDWIYCHIPFVG